MLHSESFHHSLFVCLLFAYDALNDAISSLNYVASSGEINSK